MYLPDEAVERDFRYTLDAKALGMIEGLPGKMALACYVNNHLVGVRSQIAYGDVVTMPVPKEFFVPGLNTVVFSNASNGADGKYNNWCNFDYYRLTVKGEQPGSVMMVR